MAKWGCLVGSGLLRGRGLSGGILAAVVACASRLIQCSSMQRSRPEFWFRKFCGAWPCPPQRRARSSHLQAESWAILDPVATSQWAARQRFGRAVKVSQGAPRHMAAGEHTVAAAAKNCIAMAPTSWRSIEGGSSAGLHIGRERGE